MKQSNLHKTLNILLRLTIVGLSVGFIYWKVFAKSDFKGLADSIRSYGQSPDFLKGLLLIVGLMVLNWSVESLKWQRLLLKLERISFLKALQSVLTGVTVSIFTPNRTGEFIGRAFTLKNNEPVKAVLLSIIGSLSQLMVTILIGTIGLALTYRDYLPAGTVIPAWAHSGMISGIILLDLVVIAGFFNVPIFGQSLKRYLKTRQGRIQTYLQVIAVLNRVELFRVFLLSLFRYCIFSCQFYLMIRLFGIHLTLLGACTIIPLIFLTLAVIPTFALSELGVRGSVSLFFIGTFINSARGIALSESESLAVLLAAALLWLINLAVPALLGVPFVFNLRFFRK